MTSSEKELSPQSSSSGTTGPKNRYLLAFAALTGCLALAAGCRAGPPNTFTFTADLPPGFAYVAAVHYVPEKGQTCTVERRDNLAPVFNSQWRTDYRPDAEITVRKTVKGCPLVVRKIALKINSAYGKDWGDISGDEGMVIIRDVLEERYKNTFNAAGESYIYSQCEWWFRTVGTNRRIVKILDCTTSDDQGTRKHGKTFSAYTLDQLPGKSVKLKVRLAKEEKPGWGDTWVKVPSGWKRCLGDGYEDQEAYCHGNYTDFSIFRMPDGRVCTIYPGCTE